MEVRKMLRIGLAIFVALSLFPCLFPASPAKAATPGWSDMPRESYLNALTDVWGTSSSDIFAVGYSGTIAHWDGSIWSLMENPAEDYEGITGIWGSSSSNVYAVSMNPQGYVLHYDGSSWSKQNISPYFLQDIWGGCPQ